MPGEDAIREQVRRLLAAADGFGFDGLEPHDYQKHASVVLDMIRPLVSRVAELEKQLAEYEVMNPQQCPAGKHADWSVNSEYTHACPWCRIAELEAQAEKVTAFAAQRAEYVTSILNCHPDNKHDYYRWQGHAESRRQLSQALGLPVAWPTAMEPRTAPAPAEASAPSQREAGAL
ncbi:hypothetical protein LT966_21505 [Streptomyces griseobrunneus]